MSKKIRVAIAGVGNCASALIQGCNYYDRSHNHNYNHDNSIGLTAYNLGGYEPGDIEFVAAFDVVESKVGKDLSEAIFAKPNNTVKIVDGGVGRDSAITAANVDNNDNKKKKLITTTLENKMDVKVQKSEVLDGL